MREAKGFTLLELLIAAAILGILLSLLASFLHNTRRSYEANEELSLSLQAKQVAVSMLRHEVALAGYRGVDADASGRDLGGPALSITEGATVSTPDQLHLRYFDDRDAANPKLREITFSAARNNLRRKSGSGSLQPAAEGVKNFQVTRYLDASRGWRSSPPPLEDLKGIDIELSFADGDTRDVTISFQNPLTP